MASKKSRRTRPSSSNKRRGRPGGAGRGFEDMARAELLRLPVDEDQRTRVGRLEAVLEHEGPRGLALTYSFDAPASGGRFDLAVRFVGLRKGIADAPVAGDSFDRTEQLTGLLADGRRVAVTTRVTSVNSGDWRVLAQPSGGPGRPRLPRRILEANTRFAPLAHGPGVHVLGWPALVGLGAALALVVQAALAPRAGINPLGILAVSVVACVVGFIGGRLWYLAHNRKPLTSFLDSGAGIQGFLLVSLAVLSVGSLLLGVPVGSALDVTTPGIFLGIAVGRPGCFLTGCCFGRPTSSRWGLVSSDRRLRVARVPVQLFEAAAGLAIGLATLALVLLVEPAVPGAVFVAGIAAYTLVRQLLFPLRVESHTPWGRRLAIVASGALLAAAVYAVLG